MANDTRKFRFATKTEVKAETPEVAVDPRNLPHHPGVAKAWVNFTGTGTVTINASHNVSSITDNGTGDYTINFTTSFSSANYVPSVLARRDDATQRPLDISFNNTSTYDPTSGSFRFITHCDAANAIEDAKTVWAVFHGDQ